MLLSPYQSLEASSTTGNSIPLGLCCLDSLHNPRIGRLLLILLIPRQSSALTLEGARNPRILVRDSLVKVSISTCRIFRKASYPKGNADALLDGHAGVNDSLVSLCLLLELFLGCRCVHADVDFRVLDIYAEISELSQGPLEGLARGSDCWLGWRGLHNKMSLEADAVNLDAVGSDKLDDASCSFCLGIVILKVIVVQPQLGIGIRLGSQAECYREVCFSDGLVPNALTVAAILIESCSRSIQVLITGRHDLPSFTTSQ